MKYRKLIFLIILFASVPLYALDLIATRVQIRAQIGDISTDTVKQRWSDSLLNDRINIVQRNIAVYTRCIYGRSFITPTTGQAEYNLPSDCMTIDRVSYLIITTTSAYKKLAWRSMGGLDRDSPYWENLSSGMPKYYYERGNMIGLSPAPGVSYSNQNALKIDYFVLPTNLIFDTDVPFNGDYSLYPFHDLIILGVVIMCKTDDNRYNEVQILKAEYYRLLDIMDKRIWDKPDKAGNISIWNNDNR